MDKFLEDGVTAPKHLGAILMDELPEDGVTARKHVGAILMDEFLEDGVTSPKHLGAILMRILILFLRQSLVHSLVNNKHCYYQNSLYKLKKNTF